MKPGGKRALYRACVISADVVFVLARGEQHEYVDLHVISSKL